MTLRELAVDRPGPAVAGLCLVQMVCWTLAPALTHSAPPLDLVEMLVWGREGVVATHKHPNLPGLVLDAVSRLSRGALWPSYLVSQALVAASFAGVYLLGRELLGPSRALGGTLLLTGIYYYSWPTPEMNHNVAQMPLWAWLCLSLWHATRGRGIAWWIAAGVTAGLALWAKYMAAVLLATAFAWMLADAQARSRFATPGPWLALGAFALIALPQARFLIASEFTPLAYGMRRSLETSGGAADFALAQVACHGVLVLMAVAAGLFGPGAAGRPPEEASARKFLLTMGLGPVVAVTVAAAVTGMGARSMWGAPMFNLSGLLLLAFLSGRFDDRAPVRLAGAAAVLLLAVPAVYAASVVHRADLSDRPSRVVWPQDEIARALLESYARETGQAPGVVAGPVWEAGLVALDAPGRPSVLIDGSFAKSPWLSPRAAAMAGVLAVWPTGAAPTWELAALIDGRPVRHAAFAWTDSVSARAIELSWVIVPPERRGHHGPP